MPKRGRVMHAPALAFFCIYFRISPLPRPFKGQTGPEIPYQQNRLPACVAEPLMSNMT